MRKGVFSCVVDEHPRFHLEALRWFASLTAIAEVDPRDLVVHAVGPESSDALLYLKSRGVAIRSVAPFDGRSPHCNKVAGALAMAGENSEGTVVLCDTDVVVLEDPRRLDLPPGAIGGKVVDTPVPPLQVLEGVFRVAGVPLPPSTPLPWGKGEQTIEGNSNGGLYLIPASLLPVLAPAWEHWARWLLDRRELLSDWAFHLDQVAMVLALTTEGIATEKLGVRWNTPVHDLRRIPPDPPVPAVIHYHQEVDPQGLLRSTGYPSIDRQIARVNEAIGQLWRDAFPATTFWEWRHRAQLEPEPGTEGGDQPMLEKRELLGTLVAALAPESVIDAGCGGGETTLGLPVQDFVGIDLAPEAVRRAELARPEGSFHVGDIASFSLRADLTVCLDVLVHEPDAEAYRDRIARVWEFSSKALVVSGYDREPAGATAPTLHYHEPLSTSLKAVAPEAEHYPVREENGITTFVLLRPPARPHPRDVGRATVASVVDRHPDPLMLLLLRVSGQRTLGFFPDHAPRIWEYPVVADLLLEHLPGGSRLVDVGAGVTPLAPFLTARDYIVDTVDPSEIQRTWPPAEDWNEWGFLDYAAAGLGHRSWNCTLEELPKRSAFDGAFSISVIEHLPAKARRALLAGMAARVRPAGLMILTVDLKRGGMDLWNRNRGQTVDEPSQHGTFEDVIDEGASLGFELVKTDIVREWGDVEVDIGLIVMSRKRTARRPWVRAARTRGSGSAASEAPA